MVSVEKDYLKDLAAAKAAGADVSEFQIDVNKRPSAYLRRATAAAAKMSQSSATRAGRVANLRAMKRFTAGNFFVCTGGGAALNSDECVQVWRQSLCVYMYVCTCSVVSTLQ